MMKNPFKVLIISCWCLLLVMVCLKPLLSDQLLAGTSNQTFINVCEYLDKSFLYYIFAFIINVSTCSLHFMAVLKEKKPNLKWFIPICIYVILKLVFTKFNDILFIIDILVMIGLPIIINKKLWLRSIVGFLLIFVFQLISQILKLENAKFFDKHFLTATIMSIDYYIMLILYWLYSIKERKEVKING